MDPEKITANEGDAHPNSGRQEIETEAKDGGPTDADTLEREQSKEVDTTSDKSAKPSSDPRSSGDSLQDPAGDNLDEDDVGVLGLGGVDTLFEGAQEMLEWIKNRISLAKLTRRMWTGAADATVLEFLSNPSVYRLVIFVGNDGVHLRTGANVQHHFTSIEGIEAVASTLSESVANDGAAARAATSLLEDMGACGAKEFMYFVRPEGKPLTVHNMRRLIKYGRVSGHAHGLNAMGSLLRAMNTVFAGQFRDNASWPESVRKDFAGQLHKFVASLTETTNQSKGKTILYIPLEAVDDPEAAARDKDLVQRLESTMIRWTRQIKEVVNNQDMAANTETSGPLEEIQFWRSRTQDLSGISQQLEKPGIQKIVAVLECVKSSYLAPFQSIADMIQRGSQEATDNLHFLSLLFDPCFSLSRAKPSDIPKILPEILAFIRIICTASKFYNTEERLTGLLRKVSNEIIRCCCGKIRLSEIFDGDVEASMVQLHESIAGGVAWKQLYKRTADAVAMHTKDESKHWNFDIASIFAQVDAFVQRCRDLLEVCEGQIQFARKSRDLPRGVRAPLPVFGGTRGAEIAKQLLEIEDQFAKHIDHLRGLEYDVLDVKATRWHEDYNHLKNGMKDLEVMMQNVINSAFESVTTVAAGVDLLEAFSELAKREAITRCVTKKTAEVFQLFGRELDQIRLEFDQFRASPPLRADEPRFAGAALWARGLQERADRDWSLLHGASHFLAKTREAEEVKSSYDTLVQVLEDYAMKMYQDWMSQMHGLDQSHMLQKLEIPLMSRVGGAGGGHHRHGKHNHGHQHPHSHQQAGGEASSAAHAEGGEHAAEASGKDVPGAAGGESTRPGAASGEDAGAGSHATGGHGSHGKDGAGLLVSNFDKFLLRLFEEVRYWEKFNGTVQIPYVAHDISNRKDDLRVSREYVMLVVRDYNAVIGDLNSEERRLFQEHIRRLDRRIAPGLTKLTWASKGTIEWYVRDSCKTCAETHKIVRDFKTRKAALIRQCKAVGTSLLIDIQRNTVYEGATFAARQNDHRDKVCRRFEAAHASIMATLEELRRNFEGHPAEVQREWQRFVSKTDKMLGDALRQAVKRSLQDLARAINGDNKTEPQQLFKVNVVLDSNNVGFFPTMMELTQKINIVCKDLISAVKVVPRLKDVSIDPEKQSDLEAERAKQRRRYYDSISNDEDILKIMVQVMNGMSSCATELQKYLTYWDKYRPLWDLDKDAFIRRYAKANRPLSQYDIDITRYREQQSDIQAEDMTSAINFVKIDCNLLKSSLVDHCMQWQNKLTGLLNQNARAELEELHAMFAKHSATLLAKPLNLDELSDKIHLKDDLMEERAAIEARFEPLEAKYQTLAKFDVQVSDTETHKLSSLPEVWSSFTSVLEQSEHTLQREKQNMKKDLESALTSFTARVEAFREEATSRLPYGSDYDTESAFALLEECRNKCLAVRDNEERLKPGLGIFQIDLPESQELGWTETELSVLDQIWKLKHDWTEQWKEWKDNKFDNLVLGDMEMSAAQYTKSIGKLAREKGFQGSAGGAKKFGSYQALKELIDQFRQTLPLIQDLKNPAIRVRHWNQLKVEIQKEFDPFADTFTLSAVFSLGLHMHGEFISEMSANANKELAIEQSLKDIEETWSTIDIEMGDYKEVYWKVKSTEEMFTQLEDNQVALSTMKASKFFVSFKDKIERWEHNLSSVSEVVDLLLQVQRQWMYLESIFMASEDIQRQLPTESKLFAQVNEDYRTVTQEIVDRPNAVQACTREGILDMLTGMDAKLEKIQKSLDQYLETKRQSFPRFYFLSNDDLLEILGQQKDPTQVQKHIKKCFVGIKVLTLVAPGKQGNKTYEAHAMISNDGEKVPLARPVVVDGPVEMWLNDVEARMFDTVAKQCGLTLQAHRGKKEKWIKEWPGQLLITVGAIAWTAECTRALENMMKGNNKSALKQAKKKQVSYLNRLADMVRGQLTKIERSKLVALITMEIHNRDVQDRMIKANCQSIHDFDWLSQLRFYWNKDEGEFGGLLVRQTNQSMEFGYEYQGNNGRLVVTPLTDRCVLTLVTALALNRGGAPAGPAGTGKTETVKDLGKNLAKYVVVFNCSDSMDYKSVGRMFSGLVQTGGWGCFDEFNRIQIEVLSVIAQQVMSIMNAIAARKRRFNFMGIEVRCRWSCGIFITMNPGYAGRTELPDNLAALFRPVSMMVPDLALIAEVMLAAEGFRDAKPLAKKTTTLYALMIQQLSKQDHYDFGLRSLRGVLMCAGGLKRADASVSEELILLRALRDMNVPKFIREDMELFLLLINDLFPGMETPPSEQGDLIVMMRESLANRGLQVHEGIVAKSVQLYESKLTRHCNMVVGKTLSGKSVGWKCLSDATTAMSSRAPEEFQPVREYVLNPKSVSMNELYGAFDLATFEWSDGILSNVFRACAQDERPDEKWIILDGPVDTLWIESMNTVMDDNKTLTLINGDRIGMSSSMSLLFEVRDLSVASPATVSRAGMIYFDVDDLGWGPFTTSWVERRLAAEEEAGGSAAARSDNDENGKLGRAARNKFLAGLFTKYCTALLKFKMRKVSELIPVTDFNAVISLCNLYDCLATPENGVCPFTRPDDYLMLSEKWFVFCAIWSLGGSADAAGRKSFDGCLRDLDSTFPPAELVYDYYVDVGAKEWKLWDEKVPNGWRPQRGLEFAKITVPTVDTVRNTFVAETLLMGQKATMLVGDTGTGKTVLASQLLEQFTSGEGSKFAKLVVNFSSATSSLTTQEIIEGSMEKRSKDKFGPPGGKNLICFVDDFNMPRKDLFGSQPPLELIRQWIDYGGWYERAKQTWRYILDMQLMVAMGPPGGGRSVISGRLQSRFNLINFTPPKSRDMERIFASILVPKLSDFDEEVKGMGETLAKATVQLYFAVSKTFLPTPAKSHYLFNMRDVSRITQGLLLADRAANDTKESFMRMWIHESMRVFSDRFINYEDIRQFQGLLHEQLSAVFSSSFHDLVPAEEEEGDGAGDGDGMEGDDGEGGDDGGEGEGQEGGGEGGKAVMARPPAGPLFCDFLSEPVGTAEDAKAPYEEVTDRVKLKMFFEEKLEDYNMEPGFIPMDLVLFKDAIGHVCRVSRVIKQPRGNCMLVGVGGSGRQSLSRLAAYTCEQKVFQIEISKQYRSAEFHEDLKSLYMTAGGEDKPTAFIFSDTQLKEESFLEDLNNILSSGEVPNLYSKDEKMAVFEAVRPAAKKAGIIETADKLWEFFIERTRTNLHIILCMSPVGDGFRNRCRMYPALVNCTTIDYFHPWPADALTEVAARFLADSKLGHGEKEEVVLKRRIGRVFAFTHESVTKASEKMLLELKRHNYVTPTNYLELVKSYRELVEEKLREIGENRAKLSGGLTKLEEGKTQVEEMSVELEAKKVVVAEAQKECEELLVVIVGERRSADERKKQVEAQAARISTEEAECKVIAEDAERDLGKALPALEAAMAEVDKLDKSSISEVKAYASPPPAVEMVLNAVMLLFALKPDWATAKKKISEPNFLAQIKAFDKDNVQTKTLTKLKAYTNRADFTADQVRTKSSAAAALCTWVLAIELYSVVFREVAPKRAKLKAAMDKLASAQSQLKAAQDELAIVIAKVEELNEKYTTSVNEKNALREEAENLENKLDRADKLVSGLSGERVRWEASIGTFDKSMHDLAGDALVAAAFLSYAGPFDTVYRENLVSQWLASTQRLGVPYSPGFQFAGFLAKPTDVRNWNLAGLPGDNFSVENGVITTRGRRWPLMIDPQGQANKWIKNANKDVVVCTLKQPDFVRKLETSLQLGQAYLLQDVEEELDPTIEPVLTKSIVKVGNRKIIKLGDKEIDYADEFRFFVTTKLSNPHYTPEVSTKVTLVNFAVKMQGLEDQLLGEVVRQEEPKLEKQKAELVVKVAEGKNSLVELENSILKSLAEAQGSLLDDEDLVDTLAVSKKTAEAVTHQLQVAEQTEIQIDATRQGYRPVATRAAILYFVLNDLSNVDPMYQFSLAAYNELFNGSIVRSRKSTGPPGGDNDGDGDDDADLGGDDGGEADGANGGDDGAGANANLEARIEEINDFHTYAVYCYACRGLFERHKILLSLQICIKTMQHENKLPKDELDFLLRGGNVVDRSDQRPNPAKDLLDANAWDNVTELDKLPAFNGLAGSFEQSRREWAKWILSPSPEGESLPGEWDNKLTELQRMLIVRSLRLDRSLNASVNFIAHNIGAKYVEPPPFNLRAVFESSVPAMPIIFVLSPGVDPTKQVYDLAEQMGKKVGDCSLGQGQAPVATKLINDGLAEGNWVFLANCHLAASWLPDLEKIIEDYTEAKTYHQDYRLWLSSKPTPQFPLAILQAGIKQTTEPPRGIRANLIRLYNLGTDEEFDRCEQPVNFHKLHFCLSWFHALLLERRKFRSLGFNVPYAFNDADFGISSALIQMYLDEYEQVPWDAIQYLIGEANYGGRITDDWDRRLCRTYVSQYFNDEAITEDNFRMCALDTFYMPDDGDLDAYKSHVASFPLDDPPEAFGQHPNADIASMMTDSKDILGTLLSLQPRVISAGGESDDDKVLAMVRDLMKKVPKPIDAFEAKQTMNSRSDPAPLKSVLLQEIDRYNVLLRLLGESLKGLELGIQGITLITAELEDVFNAMLAGRVPDAWGTSYPSVKPLGSWVRDLMDRVEFMQGWLDGGQLPKVFWLAGFTYPTGFLTGLLQTTARKNGVSIDSLSWEFPVLSTDTSGIAQGPKEGAYMYGMFLEGARWDLDNCCLDDANPMELIANMPIVHFKPVEGKRKPASKAVYTCPLYMYPIRTGTRERPSFVVGVQLDSGAVDASFWVKRGTALLLAHGN
ncbi:Dynein heavy chain 2, axonemal [Hondaea fermentalgiana]|uniref:Dynein-1, subspecies f n=1 Tax=Hondaea fermentalgiana TaxID=2315210 RepID=A0A2R5GWD4_9STRA|nr:Dynein heavy chain 2, axonemal [Hondaea fermentalgiana]|eukprot:GBG32973.1 Dynein heavy chain 2, axonemal [Hondaea fermentalgiana]